MSVHLNSLKPFCPENFSVIKYLPKNNTFNIIWAIK